MAEVRGIYRFIDQIAPFHTQESFDNAGFLVGRGDQNVKKVLVALDITPEVAEEAVQWGAELIVAHHPVIFHPVKSITDESVTGRILLALTEHKIAAICAHMPPTEESTAVWPGRWSCLILNSCVRRGWTTGAGPMASAG